MSNQHTRTDVLFVSKGSPITELRILDKERLILYTEDPQVINQVRHWSQMLYLVPYSQGDKLIAVDFYFPKSAEKQLIKALSNKQPTVSKKGGSRR